MRKATLPIAAAAAFLFGVQAQAAENITDYSITGTESSGSFSLVFDDATSVYALSDFNFLFGAAFNTSDTEISGFGSNLLISGSPGGDIMVSNANDFSLIFDPTAASQTVNFGFGLTGVPVVGSALVAVNKTGSNGTTTDYSILGGQTSGSFSLSFDNVTSVYSLSALDLFLGAAFNTSDTEISGFGSNLLISGSPGGDIMVSNANDFSLIFDPTAASQTVGYGFSLVGFPNTGTNELTIAQIAEPGPGVPEPTTWAMMLLGFGAVGFAFRRRNRTELTLRRAT